MNTGKLDLSRFSSSHLRAILAIKETNHGPETQRRIQKRCRAHRVDERPDAQTGFSRSRGWAFDAQQMGEGVFRIIGASRPQSGLGA